MAQQHKDNLLPRTTNEQHTRNINIGITPISQSKWYMQPPSNQLPRIIIITFDSSQCFFVECILSSAINI